MSIPEKDSTALRALFVEGTTLNKGMKNKGKCQVMRSIN
jgi:hypothetical protein